MISHIKRSLKALEGKCRGAQTHIYHFELHGISLSYLLDRFPQLRFLVLYRQNLAEQYVSWKLAKESGRWVGVDECAIHKNKCVVLPEEFLQWCHRVRHRYEQLLECPGLWERAIVLSYESLSQNCEIVMATKVFPFLDVNPMPVSPRLRKQNPRPLSESVVNYSEVREVLEKQRLESIGRML